MKRLKNKTAIVTGSTKGIGRGIAEYFAGEGASVIVSGRDEQKGAETVKKIKEKGGEAFFVAADVSSQHGNENLYSSAKEHFGMPDIIVANAGMLGLGSLTDISAEHWQKTFDVNIHSLFYLLRIALPEMKQNGGGSVIVTGSLASQKGFPNHAAYCATKGAVESLVRQIAVDAAPAVRINMIAPGAIDTELYRSSAVAFPNPDTILDEVPGTIPMGKTGTPLDVAKAALFLASDESEWITGTVLTVDGGASAAG
ncbi:SDR family NAD(P)-dependent oxidoreductase [Rhodohalobacter sp. 8-1]|uniref:SDR family NAD(P)-dependent oxidoreductase n=1 Tax=Rhodohalobacter sp. 8-1 TaxID=3131972 RepID=UPI0030EC2977